MKKIYRTFCILFFVLTGTIVAKAQYCSNEDVYVDELVHYVGTEQWTPVSIGNVTSSGDSFSLSEGNWSNGINNTQITYSVVFWDNGNYLTRTEKEAATVRHYSPVINTSFSGVKTNTPNISLSASPSGGSFSGIGVTGSVFSPSDAGAGTFTIFYLYGSGGCNFRAQKSVTVSQGVTITGLSDLSKCINDSPVSLSASPSGGTYSGNGVSGSKFYPSVAGTGSHTITYTVSGVSKSVTFTVNAVPNVSLNLPVSQMSTLDNPISLSGGAPSGGSYSINGVNASTFDPSNAGEGTHTITYTSTKNSYGCSGIATDIISVVKASYNIGNKSFCEGQSLAMNSNGGAFYYNGSVISSTFTSSTFGGTGSFSVTWKKSGYADETFTVTVYAKPNVSFSSQSFCQGSSGNVPLSNYVSPTGGTFSGTNVSSGYFNTYASVGNYSISYTYSNGNCSTTKYATYSILDVPNVSLNLTKSNVYQDDAAFTLSGGSPSGGTYYVDGVNKTTFIPSDYEPGSYTIRYRYSNGNCADYAYQVLTVLESNAVYFPDLNYCENDAAVTLDPQDGGFYIDGALLTGAVFDPKTMGDGVYNVTWKKDHYQDAEFTITVHALPVITFDPLPDVCENATSLTLSGYVTGTGNSTSFSGNGVSGVNFDPVAAGAGTHMITYTVTDDYCTNTATSTIKVFQLPTVSLTAPAVQYTDDGAVSLLNYGNPAGGEFEVNGNPATTFNPSQLGEGEHTISYTYINTGGCENTATVTVTLTKRDTYIFNDMDVCTGEGNVTFPDNGGIYTIDGTTLTGNIFDPSGYAPGEYIVEWEKLGYIDSQFTVNIDLSPSIVVTPVNDKCIYDNAFDLLNFVEPKTGTFSGNGITGTEFDPAVAKAGTHDILYTVTNGNCYDEKHILITVTGVEALNFEGINGYCSTDGPVDLSDFVDQPGGTFTSEDGGVMGTILYPEQLTQGNHTVEYTINVGSGCEQTDHAVINVMHPPNVTLAAFADVWVDADPFTLYGGSPSGGQYYVNGELTNTLNPAQLGIGTYTIRYVYSNSACENSAETDITIAPLQTSSFIDRNLCLADAPLKLAENGGTFSVDASPLTDGIFNPGDFGVGAWNVTWEKTGFEDAHFTINVYKSPDVIFVQVPDQCVDGESIDLTYFVEPKTGNFSGAGLHDISFFDPSRVGPGEYSVLYTIKNDYCYRELEIPINVNELDDITFSGLDIVCKNSSPVDLSKFVSIPGGIFSCADGGVIDNKLFPSMLEGGPHIISYTIKNSGCSKTEDQLIYIVEPENVSFDLTSFENLYSNSAPVFLNVASPIGGIYYVNGIQTNIFDPSQVGSGLHSVSYNYTDNITGCSGINKINVTVKGKKLSNFGDRKICQHDLPIEFDLDGGKVYVDNVLLTDGIFDPSNYSPGIYPAVWQKSGYAETNFSITVLESTEISTFEIPDLCESDSKIDLFDFVEPKSGTFAGSALVDGQYFDPSIYGGGEFNLVYTVKNGLCYDEKTLTIKVNGIDDIVFEGLPYSICNASSQFDLLDYVYPKTGHFTNEEGAIINDILYPSLLSDGVHTITYTINNPNGCDQVIEKKIYILEEPSATLSVPTEICQSEKAFRFTGGSPIGGNYYVDGKQVVLFDPSGYTAGLHIVEYRFKNAMGCETAASAYINVISAPQVTLQAQDILCDNGNPIALKGGYPYGGQYFINGEAKTTFDPQVYGAGDYLLEYRYTDNGCTATAEQPLQVAQTALLSIYEVPATCKNASPFELTQGSPAGGYYTIDGKTVESLNPSLYSAGMHTLVYNLENNGCTSNASTELQILETENFSINIPSDICENDNVMTLNVVSPSGGTYSGSGVASNKLDASSIGAGTYYYEYNYTSTNGCKSTIPFIMSINQAPEIIMPDISTVCTNSDAFALSASPSGGTFSGTGVVNSVYYPSLTSKGVQNINYTVTNKYGCTATEAMSLLINEPEDLTIEDVSPICQNGDPVELNFITPSGGTYSGTGITDNVIYPDRTTAGVKTIRYSYTDRNGCVSTAETKLTVREKPDIQDFYLNTLCSNDAPVELDTEMLYTKSVYMGKGVVNNTFSPVVAGAGTAKIRYLVVDTYGCSNYSEKNVNVKEAPYVFIQAEAYCEGSESIDLDNGYPNGGTFTGNFIVNNKFMPVNKGVYDVQYAYTASNGCSEIASNYLTVNEIPEISMQTIPDICINSEPIVLEGASPTGGKYYLGDEQEEIKQFDPSVYGIGSYTINYVVFNTTGCTSKISRDFKVMETEEVAIVDMKEAYCKNDESFNLSENGYPLGGTWKVNGNITYQFYPSELPAGLNTVEYSYDTQAGCNVVISKEVKVSSVPEKPEMEMKSVYCPDDVINISPKNYVDGLDIVVETNNSTSQKVDYGQKSYNAKEVNTLNLLYESAEGCTSELKSYTIEVENRNPSFATEIQNIDKGDALEIKALDDYSYITDYIWTFSDGGVSYDAQPFHYFNIPGKNSFTLDYTTESGCSFSKNWVDYIWVNNTDNITTDVEDDATLKTILYPNPAKEKVNIVPALQGDYTILIYDSKGQLCITQKDNSNNAMVNVSALAPGTYNMLLKFKEQIVSKLFIIQ